MGYRLRGDLTSFYYADGWDYAVRGAGFIGYYINFGTGFPDNNPNNEDPTLELKILFAGGVAEVIVNYYEGGSTVFYVYNTGWRYHLYFWALTPGKTVSSVWYFNFEWWVPGNVWVDIGVIQYD